MKEFSFESKSTFVSETINIQSIKALMSGDINFDVSNPIK